MSALLPDLQLATNRLVLSVQDPYPYSDYASKIRTPSTVSLLKQMDEEQIVLLKNDKNTLPLSKSIGSVAVIGPSAGQVLVGSSIESIHSKRFL